MSAGAFNIRLELIHYRWSDQGAFTGNMMSIQLTFYNVGRRWFSGKNLNAGFDPQKFPHVYDSHGNWRVVEKEENSYDSGS